MRIAVAAVAESKALIYPAGNDGTRTRARRSVVDHPPGTGKARGSNPRESTPSVTSFSRSFPRVVPFGNTHGTPASPCFCAASNPASGATFQRAGFEPLPVARSERRERARLAPVRRPRESTSSLHFVRSGVASRGPVRWRRRRYAPDLRGPEAPSAHGPPRVHSNCSAVLRSVNPSDAGFRTLVSQRSSLWEAPHRQRARTGRPRGLYLIHYKKTANN